MNVSWNRRAFVRAMLLAGVAAAGALGGAPLHAGREPAISGRAGSTSTDGMPALPRDDQALLRLRVVTLNVWALPLVSRETAARLTAIVQQLSALEADIVCLQEVWLEAARQQIVAQAQAESELRHHYYFKSGIRESGLLVLSRFPIKASAFHRFELSGHPERVAEAEFIAGKGVGYVRVQTEAGALDVYNTHLLAQYTTDDQDPYPAHRTAAVYDIVKFVDHHSARQPPLLLLGDLNIRPDQLGYRLLTCIGGLSDSYRAVNPDDAGATRTGLNPYTPDEETRRIDYIFTRDGASVEITTLHSQVILDERPGHVDGRSPAAYSDHYGVLSELELDAARSLGEADEDCASAGAIWAEFLSYTGGALQAARRRQAEYRARGTTGALAAPALFIWARRLVSHDAARGAAGDGAGPHQGVGSQAGPRLPFRARRFLARVTQGTAAALVAPVALLQGWLGFTHLPDEIETLEALREELLLRIEQDHAR